MTKKLVLSALSLMFSALPSVAQGTFAGDEVLSAYVLVDAENMSQFTIYNSYDSITSGYILPKRMTATLMYDTFKNCTTQPKIRLNENSTFYDLSIPNNATSATMTFGATDYFHAETVVLKYSGGSGCSALTNKIGIQVSLEYQKDTLGDQSFGTALWDVSDDSAYSNANFLHATFEGDANNSYSVSGIRPITELVGGFSTQGCSDYSVLKVSDGTSTPATLMDNNVWWTGMWVTGIGTVPSGQSLFLTSKVGPNCSAYANTWITSFPFSPNSSVGPHYLSGFFAPHSSVSGTTQMAIFTNSALTGWTIKSIRGAVNTGHSVTGCSTYPKVAVQVDSTTQNATFTSGGDATWTGSLSVSSGQAVKMAYVPGTGCTGDLQFTGIVRYTIP